MIRIKGDIRKEFENASKKIKDDIFAKTITDLKANTPVDTGEAREGWIRDKDTIINNVDHIEFLNKGSSQQAPKYFIEKTVLAQEGLKSRGTIVRSN